MNIKELIEKQLKKLNNKNYIYEKVDNEYVPIKFNDFIYKSKCLATYLMEHDLKNKRILLIGKNSINYLIADTAVTIYTGVSVNINRDTKEELDGVIKNLKISAVIYTNEQEEKIKSLKSKVQKINIDTLVNELPQTNNKFKRFNYNSCAKIVFSSGTTSSPKGVMLSLKNMFAGWNCLYKRIPLCEEDVVYLFLPFHHTYSIIYNFYYSFISGLTIYLSSGVNNIINELREVNPTVFCCVPLIYERINEYYQGNVKDAFGTRIKNLYAGGAPIDIDLKKNYKKNGLYLLDTYALTETASSFAVEYKDQEFDGNVGTLYEDMEFKVIDEDENGIGEICAKGDAVFIGYTNKKYNTVFTEDGFFKTGDLGYIKNNKLYIKGRKKRVLIGSNGENIYIDDIKNKLIELDSNINYVNVRLNKNNLEVVLYLEDKTKTNVKELIEKYNSLVVQKDKIKEYSVSSDKNYQKLVS